VAGAKQDFVAHLEKLIAGAIRQVRMAHGDVLPGSVARRVASQLWGEASMGAHPNPSAWVRHVRSSLGLTQSQLAERLGTSQVTVARWETGKMEPAPYYRRAIEDLARTLGRSTGTGVRSMAEATT
jgi:DNA-binding transcriptional regulator YiaG